jgi:hypothetical protein
VGFQQVFDEWAVTAAWMVRDCQLLTLKEIIIEGDHDRWERQYERHCCQIRQRSSGEIHFGILRKVIGNLFGQKEIAIAGGAQHGQYGHRSLMPDDRGCDRFSVSHVEHERDHPSVGK